MNRSLRILIVDDQPRTRQSLKALLSVKFPMDEVREAASGIEAIQSLEQDPPDLILMDARMPEMDGIETTRLIKAKHPQVKIIILSMFSEYQAAALAAGADGYLAKEETLELLLATYASLSKSNHSEID